MELLWCVCVSVLRPDGAALVCVSPSVSDVRQFLVAARPNMAATEFVLMTTFPNKELADESQSLRDANLLNAVIVQRLK